MKKRIFFSILIIIFTLSAAALSSCMGGGSSPTKPSGKDVVIAKKGDVNLDGDLLPVDVSMFKAAQLGKLDTFTELQYIVADLNGDGVILPIEVSMIKAAQLGKLELSW